MSTKDIGDVSEAMVTAALLRIGHVVLRPVGDNRRYDLLIEQADGSFSRVQCKTGRLKFGAIYFPTSTSYHHRGRSRRNYRGDAEEFGVYCPETNQCYLVPVSMVPCREAALRVDDAKNGQTKKVRFAAEFAL